MEGMPNRKQRRQMAKQAGFLKKKNSASFKEWSEITRRANEFGKQIQLSNIERMLRADEAKIQEKEQENVENLLKEGKTPEEVMKIIEGE